MYDAANRRIASVDALGNRTSFGYDAAGRRVSATDPLGNVNSMVYDAANRLTATSIRWATGRSLGYDAGSRLVGVTNPLGMIRTTCTTTPAARIASIDPLGNTSTAVFDAAGRRIAPSTRSAIVNHGL